jgi:hypothetical protein
MLVVFTRAAGGSTLVTLHRRDGVVVELPGYDRKYRVPHDLAHLVTERELELADGVFGSVAGGGMFSNMRVVSGKPRHDAGARSKRLLDANKRGLSMAEVLAGAMHDAAEHDAGAQSGGGHNAGGQSSGGHGVSGQSSGGHGVSGQSSGGHGVSGAPAAARRVWRSFGTGPFPWTDQQIVDAVRTLAKLTEDWLRDGRLETTWPDRLTAPVPTPATGVRRSRQGRN